MCTSTSLTEVVLELASSCMSSGGCGGGWCPHPQTCCQRPGLLMTNLLMRATNRPAPIGSIMVGIVEGAENYCGDGSVVTGVTSFQGWVRDF